MSFATSALKIEKVNKYFGKFQALKSVSVDVRTGEKVVICGPSGSGKSTLIRCINRIETHDSGNIVIGGTPLTSRSRDIAKIRQDVGMVFQNFNLFPHLTILENCILAPMKSRKVPKDEAVETARHYLEKVHIRDQAKKYPAQLSGGQQQRAAIARALCMKPRIMLFDEPTSALDPEMVQEVLDTMVELAREGMTMICVTHEMKFAREVADRIVFMAGGEIVEISDVQTFFSAPETERARDFLRRVIA